MLLRHALVAAVILVASLPAAASDISQIQSLSPPQFRLLSEDLGAALSYKPLIPSEPLGLFGFDIGVAATTTKLENPTVFNTAGAGNISSVAVPSLRLHLGLPLGLDVGAMVGAVPGTNIQLYGAELRWAFVKGGTAMPAIALRGSYTQLAGVDQLDFNTKGVDLSISKGFALFTPYGGIGKVWVTSTPNVTPNPTNLSEESFSLNKAFVGLNVNFALVNIAIEGDKTGDATSYGAKLGFRF